MSGRPDRLRQAVRRSGGAGGGPSGRDGRDGGSGHSRRGGGGGHNDSSRRGRDSRGDRGGSGENHANADDDNGEETDPEAALRKLMTKPKADLEEDVDVLTTARGTMYYILPFVNPGEADAGPDAEDGDSVNGDDDVDPANGAASGDAGDGDAAGDRDQKDRGASRQLGGSMRRSASRAAASTLGRSASRTGLAGRLDGSRRGDRRRGRTGGSADVGNEGGRNGTVASVASVGGGGGGGASADATGADGEDGGAGDGNDGADFPTEVFGSTTIRIPVDTDGTPLLLPLAPPDPIFAFLRTQLRRAYVEHMEAWIEGVRRAAVSRTEAIRARAAETAEDLLRAMPPRRARVELDIYNARLLELVANQKRLHVHMTTVAAQISALAGIGEGTLSSLRALKADWRRAVDAMVSSLHTAPNEVALAARKAELEARREAAVASVASLVASAQARIRETVAATHESNADQREAWKLHQVAAGGGAGGSGEQAAPPGTTTVSVAEQAAYGARLDESDRVMDATAAEVSARLASAGDKVSASLAADFEAFAKDVYEAHAVDIAFAERLQAEIGTSHMGIRSELAASKQATKAIDDRLTRLTRLAEANVEVAAAKNAKAGGERLALRLLNTCADLCEGIANRAAFLDCLQDGYGGAPAIAGLRPLTLEVEGDAAAVRSGGDAGSLRPGTSSSRRGTGGGGLESGSSVGGSGGGSRRPASRETAGRPSSREGPRSAGRRPGSGGGDRGDGHGRRPSSRGSAAKKRVRSSGGAGGAAAIKGKDDRGEGRSGGLRGHGHHDRSGSDRDRKRRSGSDAAESRRPGTLMGRALALTEASSEALRASLFFFFFFCIVGVFI